MFRAGHKSLSRCPSLLNGVVTDDSFMRAINSFGIYQIVLGHSVRQFFFAKDSVGVIA